MILFCEECGARHDIDPEQLSGNGNLFLCSHCKETLAVNPAAKINRAQASMGRSNLSALDCPTCKPLKVMIVDDSKVIRKALRNIIESDARKLVVGEAENGKAALQMLQNVDPDVITLDINMPVMDGLTTLKHIMLTCPRPTVMISALTHEGAFETFEALKYGAIDFLAKPAAGGASDMQLQNKEIHRKIELAAGVQLESVRYLRGPSRKKEVEATHLDSCRDVLAFGVAEGGYGALLNVVPHLRPDLPAAYVAVMHQASRHIDAFADYLDQFSRVRVLRAAFGLKLTPGVCYLVAANECTAIARQGTELTFKEDSEAARRFEGPIDHMMASLSDALVDHACGVILTGTGMDGLDGLGSIIKRGGTVFVQNPCNCLFKETPLAATGRFAVDYLVSDKQMAAAINSFLMSRP